MTSSLPVVSLLVEESTIDPSSPLPSFFELKLVEATTLAGRKAIHSSLDAFIERLSVEESKYPIGSLRQKLAKSFNQAFLRYHAEVQLIVNYLINRGYLLSNANSIMSESFYGMKRSKVLQDGSMLPMNKLDGVRAAIILSVWPYLKSQLDHFYESERDNFNQSNVNEDQGRSNQRKLCITNLRRVFIRLYPFLHMSSDGIKLVYQFAYLIGQTLYFDPSQHFLRLVVRRIAMQDITNDENVSQNIQGKSILDQIPKHTITRLKKVAGIGIVSALAVGWLGKFNQHMRNSRRRWIVNSEASLNGTTRRDGAMNEVIIPPPPLPRSMNSGERIDPPINKAVCPICLEKRINPVASSSGHVFCFKCLIAHIGEKGPRCPVTLIPCDRSQIVQLYEPNDH